LRKNRVKKKLLWKTKNAGAVRTASSITLPKGKGGANRVHGDLRMVHA